MRLQDTCAVGGGRDDMLCSSHPSVGSKTSCAAEPTAALAAGNVDVGSHGQYVRTVTDEAL